MHCIVFFSPEEDVEESEPEEHAESAEEGAAEVEVVAVGGEESGQAEKQRLQMSQLKTSFVVM